MSVPIRTYGERWHGFTPAPKPPAHIWTAMEDAGRTRDTIALGIARARYIAWLEDQGIHGNAHGSEAPKEAFE